MIVDRSEAFSLSRPLCHLCQGTGWWQKIACPCVWRQIFRQCLNHYHFCREKQRAISGAAYLMSAVGGRRIERHAGWSRPLENYLADLELIGNRNLPGKDWILHRLYHLEQRPWKECSGITGLPRPDHFHMVYKIEGLLGKAFAQNCLFPISTYHDDVAVHLHADSLLPKVNFHIPARRAESVDALF